MVRARKITQNAVGACIFIRWNACDPKPYKIVGYDPLIRGSDPLNGRFLDPQVRTIEIREARKLGTGC